MNKQTTYQLQPEILSLIRKLSGMSEEDIAKKLKLPKVKYQNIESGKDLIPENLLLLLADIYKRPLISFYSSNIISTPQLPHDYRLNRDKKISPEIYLAKRKAIYLAEQLSELNGMKSKLPEVNNNVLVTNMAEKVRSLLGIDFKFLTELIESREETALGYYKSAIEEKFSIPIIEHPLKSTGVRAFSIFGDLSVIILNESDSVEVKLFSLMHELCHLLKRQDGICSIDPEKDLGNQPEERFCDEFAANLLMPEQDLYKAITGPITSLNQVEKIAKLFGVSKQVTLIRLKEFKIIQPSIYKAIKSKLESLTKKGFGLRNWERTYINRTSRLILNNLINSYKKGDLTYSSLSTITGIKDKYLQKMV